MKIYKNLRNQNFTDRASFKINPRFLRHAEFCHAQNSFSSSAIVPDNDCVKKNPNKKKPLLAMT